MAKVFMDTGNGFEYIGEAGPMTIQFTPDPLDAEVVLDDVLDADVIGTEPPVVING
jgi:hypothetical protein